MFSDIFSNTAKATTVSSQQAVWGAWASGRGRNRRKAPPPNGTHKTRSATAFAAAFTLAIGGIFLGQTFQPEAEALAGPEGLSHQPGVSGAFDPHWETLPNIKAQWLADDGTVAADGSKVLSTDSVYWTSDYAAGQSLDTMNSTSFILGESYNFEDTPTTTTYQTRPRLMFRNTGGGGSPFTAMEQFSTQAIAPIGGNQVSPDTPLSVYFWAHDGRESVSTSVLNCAALTGRPASATIPVTRVTDGSPDVEVGCMPAPDSDTIPPVQGNRLPYGTGGEGDQLNGLIYLQGMYGLFDTATGTSGANNTSEVTFSVWDPVSGAYSLSGPIQPYGHQWGSNAPSDARARLSDGGGSIYAAADFGLDATGNIYIYAGEGTGPNSGDGHMALIRIAPRLSADGDILDGSATEPWQYTVVQKLTKASPGIGVQTGQYFVGTGIHNGKFLIGGYGRIWNTDPTSPYPDSTAGTDRITTAGRMGSIDPLTGQLRVIGSTQNATVTDTVRGTFTPAETPIGGYRDNASAQMLTVITGHVYHDTNADGSIDDPKGMGGYTVGIYDATGKLLGSQVTAADGSYSHVVSGEGTYLIRVVQPKINGVNAVQTWGSTVNPLAPNATLNQTTIHCAPGGGASGANDLTQGMSGKCDNALDLPFTAPPLGTVGQTYDPATWPIYATVQMTNNAEVGYADFGITAFGSYGDSAAGPATIAAGAPVHVANNNPALWLGANLGRYNGPATDDLAHDATDDGLYFQGKIGVIPIDIPGEKTYIVAGKEYTLGAIVSGPEAASVNTAVEAWTTNVNSRTWLNEPAWGANVANGSIKDGRATGTFVARGGTVTNTTPQLVYIRAEISSTATTRPNNSLSEYQATAANGGVIGNGPYWATDGEIEDYSVYAATAVVRSMVNTTSGSGVFSLNGTQLTASSDSVKIGPVQYGADQRKTITAINNDPSKWAVAKVDVVDTSTGMPFGATPYPYSTSADGRTTTIDVTPAMSDDITVLVTYKPAPSATLSTLELINPTTVKVGESVTAKVTVKAADGTTLVPGETVYFTSESGSTLSAATCVTSSTAGDDFGTCTVTLTSQTANTAANPSYDVRAKLSIGGSEQDVSGSPKQATFESGAATQGTLAVAPKQGTAPLTVGTGDANKYTATATLQDGDGNAVEGQTVNFAVVHNEDDSAVDPAKTAFSPAASCETGANGTCSVDLASTDDGAYRVSATTADPVDSTKTITLSNQPVVNWRGDVATTTTARLTLSATRAPVGESPVATATATDQYGNAPGTATTINFTVDGAAEFTGAEVGTDPSTASCTIAAGATTCMVRFIDQTAESVSVAATLNGTAIANSPLSLLFTDDAFSCVNSNFRVAPMAGRTADTVVANGADSWVGTLTARDGNSLPISGMDPAEVTWLVNPTGLVTVGAVTEASPGVYTLNYTTTTARSYGVNVARGTGGGCNVEATDLAIKFVAGPADGTKSTIVATSPITAGDSAGSTITVKLFDANNNPLATSGGIVQVTTDLGATSAVTDNQNGTYTATLTSTEPGTANVGFSINGAASPNTAQVIVQQGGVSATNSTLDRNPASQRAGSPVVVSVTVRDEMNLPLNNLTLSDFVLTGTSPQGLPDLVFDTFANTGNGVYTFSTTSKLMGAFTLGATVKGVALTQHPQVTFTAGAVCTSNCAPVDNPVTTDVDESTTNRTRFAVTVNGVVADNSAANRITGWAYDTYGNPVSGAAVVIEDQTSGDLIDALQPQTGNTTTGPGGDGGVSFRARMAGRYTLFAEVDGQRADTSVLLMHFVSGDVSASNSTLELDRNSLVAGESSIATVTTRDRADNLVGGVSVTLTVPNGSDQPNPKVTIDGVAGTATCTTINDADDPRFGTCSVPVSSRFAGTYSVDAVVNNMSIDNSPQPITFQAGQVCFTNCATEDDPTTTPDESVLNRTHVAMTDADAVANGTDHTRAMAYAYDTYGNPVQGASVLTVPLTSTLNAPTAPATTGALGQARIDYTSTVAGPAQAHVYINSALPTDALGPSPVSMTFTNTGADPLHSTLSISPTTSQTIDSTFVVTATVMDSTGNNPVSGAQVTFSQADSRGVLTNPATGLEATVCTTGPDGTCSLELASKKAVTYQVGATIPNAAGVDTRLQHSPVTATFTAGDLCIEGPTCPDKDPEAPSTSVVLDANDALNDGVAANIAIVSAYDKYGNPVSGVKVTSAAAVGSSLTVQPGILDTDAASGKTNVNYTSLIAGPQTATVTVSKGAITGTPSGSPVVMNFSAQAGSADHSSFTIEPKDPALTAPLKVGELDANTYRVTATVNNESDVPVAGTGVSFAVTPAGPTWVGGTLGCTTGNDGTCFVDISSKAAGTFAITARMGQASIGQAQSVVWLNEVVCVPSPTMQCDEDPLKQTRVELGDNNQFADGIAYDTAILHAFDRYGNPVPGVLVASTPKSPDTAETLIVHPDIAGTDSTGKTTIRYSSTIAGDHIADVTVDTDQRTPLNSPITLTFQAGPINALESTIVFDQTSTEINGSLTGTVTARDAKKNLVGDAVITVSVNGAATMGINGVAPSGKTGACTTSSVAGPGYGTCTVTVTDASVEDVTVTATTDILGSATPITGSGTVLSFRQGADTPIDWDRSAFSVTPVADPSDTTNMVNWQDGDGTGAYTGILSVVDTDGLPKANLALSDIQFNASDPALVAISNVQNMGDGTY
ncbi:MAG: Ig-like domain-containing protein, partial [Propionibacteriaceae bacterium]|nr:Ig-like domain-containing protein [Propionibacteriaceae bacterium]